MELERLRTEGRKINSFRNAEDTVMIADKGKNSAAVDGLFEEYRRYGWSVNKSKTK